PHAFAPILFVHGLGRTMARQDRRDIDGRRMMLCRCLILAALTMTLAPALGDLAWGQAKPFEIVEATISDIHNAIESKQITTTDLVNRYLARIKAYNGRCVEEPQGVLGPVSPIPHAGQINALMTLNLRPAARQKWGFDARKARSMTDSADNDANMP